MAQKLLVKLDELSRMLQMRNNDSCNYFRDMKNSIINKEDIKGRLRNLIKCYAITQYANFNHEEEVLLSEIIDLAREELGVI